MKRLMSRKTISHNASFVGLNNSRISTSKAAATLSSCDSDGCILLEHQRETVFSLISISWASHLHVFFLSARTALMRFSAIFWWFYANISVIFASKVVIFYENPNSFSCFSYFLLFVFRYRTKYMLYNIKTPVSCLKMRTNGTFMTEATTWVLSIAFD